MILSRTRVAWAVPILQTLSKPRFPGLAERRTPLKAPLRVMLGATPRKILHRPTSATGAAWERTSWHAPQGTAWDARKKVGPDG